MKQSADKTVIFTSEGIVGTLVHKSANAELVKLTLEPGANLQPHLVDFAAIFYVITGQGLFFYQDHKEEIRAGDTVEAEPNTKRGFLNTGKGQFEILVIKS